MKEILEAYADLRNERDTHKREAEQSVAELKKLLPIVRGKKEAQNGVAVADAVVAYVRRLEAEQENIVHKVEMPERLATNGTL